MNEKDARLAAYCREFGFGGVHLQRRANISWITDGADTHIVRSSERGIASIVWMPERKIVLTDNIEATRLCAEEFDSEWEVTASDWWREPAACLPGGNFATDYPDDRIARLRFSLTDLERRRVRELGAETVAVIEAVLRNELCRGMSENELAGRADCAFRMRGIHLPVLLVGADDRIARFRHPIPTARSIEKAVMVAVCAQRFGLIVSATRLVHFGELPENLRQKHDAVCAVAATLVRETRPGRRWCDIFSGAIAAYESMGYADEWKKHHQGGPMGYECRDFKATPSEEREVVENQLVGWNPSITGTKSEVTMLSDGTCVTPSGDWPTAASGLPGILSR